MKVKAVAKKVGVSAIKARVVADTVRGMNAQDAVGILTYVSKGAALPVKKVIQSAIANAKTNNVNSDTLIISEIRVDKGPMAKINSKRFETLGKGGYARFDRKYCHITVVLDDRTGEKTLKKSKKSNTKEEAAIENVEVSAKKTTTAKVATKKVKAAKKSE